MRTWDATGLLAPIWQELDREDGKPGPGRRDDLAAITGIAGPTLSQYNAGTRRLGLGHAKEILKAAPQGYTIKTISPASLNVSRGYSDLRGTGRSIQLTVQEDASKPSGYWRWGLPRLEINPGESR